MSKRRTPRRTGVAADAATARAAARRADIDNGIRRRAWTAQNGRAVASRTACRRKDYDR